MKQHQKDAEGALSEDNLVVLARRVVSEARSDSTVFEAFGACARAVARSDEGRARIASEVPVLQALKVVLDESKSGSDSYVCDALATIANLFIGDEDSGNLHRCDSLQDAGVLTAFFKLSQRLAEDVESPPNATLFASIAMANFARQIKQTAESEPVLRKIVGGGNFTLAMIKLACETKNGKVRDGVISSVHEFTERSSILKDALLDFENAEGMAVVAKSMKDPQDERTNHALDLLVRTSQNLSGSNSENNATSTLSPEKLEKLVGFRIVEHVVKIMDANQERREDAARFLQELGKLELSDQGMPVIDDKFKARTKILSDAGVVQIASNILLAERNFDEGNIAVSQFLSGMCFGFLLGDNSSEQEKAQFISVRDCFVEASHRATDSMSPLVKQLRDLIDASIDVAEMQTAEESIRKQILPSARFRLFCLGGLNALASNETNCKVLLQGDIGRRLIHLCKEVIEKSYDFDIEASRYAVNLLRNLSLKPRNQEKILDAFEPHELGSVLVAASKKSRDPNTAAYSAAIVRLFCARHDKEILLRFMSQESVETLKSLGDNQALAFAHVEISRAFAHMVCTDTDELRSSLMTDSAFDKICFLFQSKEPLLLNEALEALQKCDPAFLKSLLERVSLNIGTQEAPQQVSLKMRLEDVGEPEKIEALFTKCNLSSESSLP